MFEALSRITETAHQATARLRVNSSLNPILWLSGITTPLAVLGTIFTDGFAQQSMILLMFLGPIACVIGFLWFMFISPDKLRSEDYEVQKSALEMIMEKGGTILESPSEKFMCLNISFSA